MTKKEARQQVKEWMKKLDKKVDKMNFDDIL